MDNKFEGTRVDLGDDLVTQPQDVAPKESKAAVAREETADDLLRSAEILMGEGLVDDAKKTLRRIMIQFPEVTRAKARLEEIQESEIKKIFLESVPRKKYGDQDPYEANLKRNREDVLEQLEKDLKLAPDSSRVGFQLDETFVDFYQELESKMGGASGSDRLDLGFALFEMGLYGLACKQFELAISDADRGLDAAAWFGYSLLLADRPFEVILALEPFVQDTRIEQERRAEFVYLTGRAFESMRNFEQAIFFLQIVETWVPGYRDTSDRIASITERFGEAKK
ncbi:MAG: hypothetical protein JNL01_06095 [Bdellovibrionales bacterium]|nr:hypothetical protein [Bdellovibrionales bacterium]